MEEACRSLDIPTSARTAHDDDPATRAREQLIAEVWQEAFGLDQVDPDANFFELGGNSSLAMQLAGRLSSRLGILIPVVVLFQYPSVRELSQIITAAHAS